jgi:polysaccharide deacetylase 2 family uncharacterized protein YibQ
MSMRNQTPKRPNRKNSGGRRPIWLLLVVIIMITGLVYLLEQLRLHAPPVVDTTAPASIIPPPSPPEPYHHAEMQSYTSASSVAPPGKRLKRKDNLGAGRVAIIVDDMGASLQEARALMDIGIPLSFALIPGLPKVKEIAEAAHQNDYQIMIHIPMEPSGYPQKRLENNGLLLMHSEDEICSRVDSYLKSVPYAKGANNHMGSRFTEDSRKMGAVLDRLKSHGLFFIDSRTSPNSVGFSLARSRGIDAAGRNVFLDNNQDVAAIKSQLELLAAVARKKGNAIAICHPRKSTIEALAQMLPEMRKEGITFVKAGDLAR